MADPSDILRTFIDVNRILIREMDKEAVMQQTCSSLVGNGLFTAVWICRPDGELLVRAGQDPPEGSPVSFAVKHKNNLFGHFNCISPQGTKDEDMTRRLQNLAEDIAFTLYRIEKENRLQLLKKEFPANRQKLKERVKELKCLYAISRLVEKQGISLDEIYQGVLQFIPAAWQYPEITCARIKLEDREFSTDNFRETNWKQSREIIVDEIAAGVLEIFYLKKMPDCDDAPFLEEENALISTIAERLGKAAENLQMRAALLEQEVSFRDLVENSLVGIVIFQDEAIVYTNSEQERISAALPIAFNTENWAIIHPDDREKTVNSYVKILSGEKKRVEMGFRFFADDGGPEPREIKWVYCRASVVEYRGKAAVLIYMMDVTRSRHLENLLRVKDKMVSLGHVTAGIAHEIRNPLSGINIYLNALDKISREAGSVDKIPEIIRQMQSASGKIESVIRRVMDFSKPTEPLKKLIDINQPVNEAINLSSVTLRKINIKLTKHLTAGLPQCHADPLLLEQVILNLITNAAEAMKNSESPKRIELSTALENNVIIISVSDSGPGVPIRLKEKIFDPFYSTKSGNTGIGLSLGHRIIIDHGGILDVGVSQWGGARFIIELPLQRQGNEKL